MKLILSVLSLVFILFLIFLNQGKDVTTPYGAPLHIEEVDSLKPSINKYENLADWSRPEGPVKVGLQAGHWRHKELPEELARLRETGGGTGSGSVAEWEVNLSIARETKKILEEKGITVDLLPATIPVGYYADAVVAIHADGSPNPLKSGFKIAAPSKDTSKKADRLVEVIEKTYRQHTGLKVDPEITRNMTNYYAFSWRRFEHATHPMTPAVILETGYLTNPQEAWMLINNPKLPAQALAEALLVFLDT